MPISGDISDFIISKEKLNIFIEKSSDVLTIQDENAVILYNSPNNKSVFGYGPDDNVGIASLELIHPEDHFKVKDVFEKIFKYPDDNFLIEYRYKHKKGDWIWIESNGKLVQEEEKRPYAMFFSRNISERVKYRKKLFQKDNLLSKLEESIDEVFWLTDWKTRKTIYVSPSYEKVYGQTCQSLYQNSKSWADTIHPADFIRVNNAYYQKAETGEYNIDFRILHSDGTILWVNERATPVIENGEVVRMAGITTNITELKLNEIELLKKEQFLEKGQSISHIGTWESNMVAEEIKWSKEHYKIFGYKDFNQKIDYDIFFKHIHPDDLSDFKRVLTESQISGEGYKIDFRIITKDDKIKHVCTISEAEKNEEGEIIRRFGTIQDISERKEKEKEDSFFRNILNNSMDSIFIFDVKNSRFVDANERAIKNLGYSKLDLLKKKPESIHTKEDRKLWQKIYKNEIEDSHLKINSRFLRKNNSSYPVEINLSHANQDGQQYMILIARDITLDEETQAALLKSDNQYTSLFENMHEALLHCSLDGEIIFINKQFEDLLGYKEKELLGKSSFKFLSSERDIEIAKYRLSDRKNGQSEQYQFKVVRKDKKHIWVNVSASPNFNLEGEVDGVMLLLSDITDKKVAEQRQTVVYNIASAAQQSDLDLKDLASIIHNEVKEVIEAENFYLAIYDKKENSIEFPYYSDESIRTNAEKKYYDKRPFSDGLTEYVIKTGKSFILNKKNIKNKRKFLSYGTTIDKISWMGVPIAVKGEIIGVLAVQSFHNDMAYFQDDEMFFHYVASQLNSILERIRDSQALKINEEKYRSLFERMNEGMMHSNKEGVIQFVNKQFAKLTGYKESELIGENGYYLLHDSAERKRLKQKLSDRKKGNSGKYEARIIKKNGEAIWVTISAAPNYNDSGDFIGVMSLINNITKEKKAAIQQEAVYNIAKAASKKILDFQYLAKHIHAEISKVVEADNFYLAIYDRENERISFPYAKDNTMSKERHKEIYLDRKFGNGLTELVISTRKPFKLSDHNRDEFIRTDKSGARPKSWMGVPFKSDGAVVGMMAIQSYKNKDIYDKNDLKFMNYVASQIGSLLERIWAFDELISKGEKYRNLFEKNLAGVYRIDDENIIVQCNDAYAKIIGYESKNDVIGKNVQNIVLNLSNEGVYTNLRKENDKLIGLESKLLLKNGVEVWVIENTGIITELNGEKYLEGTVIDITIEKQAQLVLEEERKQATQYQSMLLSSQINPHFIFNALNSVQYYILDQDIEPALNFVSDFSLLMRKVLSNSLERFITIEEEVKFLKLYLELENKRFRGKFHYKIEIEDCIDEKQFMIPPMLLQPYVENTIIHGIGNKADLGNIHITFGCENDNLICIIKDDGVGRKRASELKIMKTGNKNKSLGMGITSTRLDLLNQIVEDSFEVEIEDLFNANDEGCGTIIRVVFPLISN